MSSSKVALKCQKFLKSKNFYSISLTPKSVALYEILNILHGSTYREPVSGIAYWGILNTPCANGRGVTVNNLN